MQPIEKIWISVPTPVTAAIMTIERVEQYA